MAVKSINTIKSYLTEGKYPTASELVDVLDTLVSIGQNSGGDTSGLADVAISGDYNDLTNKPTVPTISTNIANDATSDTKTTSPKAVKDFVEGKGYLTEHQDISGKANQTDLEALEDRVETLEQSGSGGGDTTQYSYLKLIPDLDGYTEAPVGEIVKYTGQSNGKYTRGWDYEKVEDGTLPPNTLIFDTISVNTNPSNPNFAPTQELTQIVNELKTPLIQIESNTTETQTFRVRSVSSNTGEHFFINKSRDSLAIGDTVYYRSKTSSSPYNKMCCSCKIIEEQNDYFVTDCPDSKGTTLSKTTTEYPDVYYGLYRDANGVDIYIRGSITVAKDKIWLNSFAIPSRDILYRLSGTGEQTEWWGSTKIIEEETTIFKWQPILMPTASN